ncbi:uncharacterized protein LOC129941192 [Eupeodes corollae]|uniref:uncharacterized protein LOC129941192 n=1 Tax=Eupeodes corollae TaxID=290404 RepID=UPI002492023C|nr:uncharacterized protein LOC129941192 [Eupeodes corollae]
MSDVEQISGKNEIKIATGPNKTSVKLHSLPIQHHHHPHAQKHPHHSHPHSIHPSHQEHYLKPTPQHQHQQQQQHHQQQEQYREKNQHQQLSSTLTIEEGTGSIDQTEIGHSPTRGLGCFSKVLKVLFSTPGLVVLVVVYSVMGALIFPLLEAPQDIMKNVAIAKSREDCLKELWIITEKLNVLYEQNWTMLVHEQLRRFEGSIVAATRNGGMVGVVSPASSSTTAAAAVTTTGFESDKGRWSFSEALLYSVTVITTIGHGNLTPKSSAGKIATILYALIGVPLMLMCLSSLGGLLAEALQCTYTRICCRLQKVRQQHKQHQQKNRGTAAQNGLRRKSSESMGSSSCHGQSNEMDCKSCKYDPVIEETSMQNSYKYTSSSEREDSCQLLHNSPTPNSSPCIQLKSQPMPPPNLKQYHQQHLVMAQQQQQQQQQQQLLHHHQMTPSPQHQSYQMSPTRMANNTTTKYHQQVMVPNNVHAQHQHLVEQNGCTEITGTATIYFPIQTTAPPGSHHVSMPVAAAAAAVHYNHQPLVKYHTIQLQHKKAMVGGTAAAASAAMAATTTGTTTIAGPTIFEQQLPGHITVGTGMTTLTLPPPPHYQTATVHGIRRAKFLAKPMPQEINTLLAESDISCHHEGSANQQSSRAGSDSGNSSSTPGSVDIMEDEEENEHSRMGCPHGTPSRVPLIPSSPGAGGRKNYLGQDSSKTTLDTRKTASVNVASDNNGNGQQRRRVRLMTTNNSKGSRKKSCCLDSSCNLHTDPMTTEDEDYDDEDDNCKQDDDDDDNDDDEDGIPQVPITIVLLILVAYICIGTVIFALWENWSLIDGAYFCFVTLSTIGYGDFMPEHTFRGPNVQLFACCAYLLLGLVLVAMSFSILETQLMWKCKRIAVRLKLARND